MAANSGLKRLNVRNPGFDRHVISSTALHLRLAPQGGLREDWWAGLPWWESTWQAKVGVKALCARPFLHLISPDGKHALIPTQALYPNALQATDDQRIEEAALNIAAYMRQGRELYVAAESAGVTDLSRPILYYYGALAYAKAAITALFGVIADKDGRRHGLELKDGPSIQHQQALWPTIISWQKGGVFSQFYRIARWDQVWDNWPRLGTPQSPEFHVLECIRYATGEWGTLPPTGFERPRYATPDEYPQNIREGYLLPYGVSSSQFMTRQIPPTTPIFQVPRMVVRLMLLFYFSMLARYHTAEWQNLLGGANEPEGYVFRKASEEIAHYFAQDIAGLLPYPNEQDEPVSNEVRPPDPLSEDWLMNWYQYPEED